MSRITVIGAGYVGLTTGAYLAHIGHDVICFDVVPDKIERLRRGEIPIFETGLEELVHSSLEADTLTFSLVPRGGRRGRQEFVFLCLPTPQSEDGSADLTFVREEAERLGPLLETGCIVINKSTLPVGSTRMVERSLARGDVHVVSNPEFLREGTAVHDSLNPDRIVIGADDAAAASRVAALYERIHAPVLVTDPASAELIKYASNAFLATKISYINAIANLCEAVGADVKEVVLGMGYDKRIGFEFLRPGPGWGGSCFHPQETLLVRRFEEVTLMTFEELFAEVEREGTSGWEALSWDPMEPRPEFLPIRAFTSRPWNGDLAAVRTKMGRRLLVTPDHTFVTCDGVDAYVLHVRRADELGATDWLPVAQGYPLCLGERRSFGFPLDGLGYLGVSHSRVKVEMTDLLATFAADQGVRVDDLRTLSDVEDAGIPAFAGAYRCHPLSHPVPGVIPLDEAFWRIVGLYLSEGSCALSPRRGDLTWSFHMTDEEDLVQEVVDYWRGLGLAPRLSRCATTTQVWVSSPLLASWFVNVLGLGRTSYDHAIPDLIWDQPEGLKRALLGALWDGDGSWSRIAGGPSVVLEYGTVSRKLADGMLRLLGDLGLVARLKVGRTAKSTVDTYWLMLSGADQLDRCAWLLPREEQTEVGALTATQKKRIAPTGSRRLSKAATWVRVVGVEAQHFEGSVFSVEVEPTHTVVTSHGLVARNCFPKDTKALVKIAEDAGYDFGLLEGVIEVNVEQHERMVDKVAAATSDGSLDGKTIAVWGLTFKAMTDDLRDSPALDVIRQLMDRAATVRAYDPMVTRDAAADDRRLDGIAVCEDPYDACVGADVAVVLTEWDEFRWLDFAKVQDQLLQPTIVDCRNLLDPAPLRRRGFSYVGVGRP